MKREKGERWRRRREKEKERESRKKWPKQGLKKKIDMKSVTGGLRVIVFDVCSSNFEQKIFSSSLSFTVPTHRSAGLA